MINKNKYSKIQYNLNIFLLIIYKNKFYLKINKYKYYGTR